MTIPIEPGPFSFLGNVGDALGAIGRRKDEVFAQREELRRNQLAESRQQAQNYLALRAAGLMKPKDFEDPHVQAIFHAAGFGPVTPEETVNEQLGRFQQSYLNQLSPQFQSGKLSDEARAVAKAPERGLTESIDAKVAGAKAAVPQAELAGETASAQLPAAGVTAAAGQQGEQDKLYNGLATRYVESLYAQTHKLPASGADAFAAAMADPTVGEFAKRAGQSYFDQAIEGLRSKLADEQIKRAAAQARIQGASGTGLDDLAKIYSAQQQRITAELNAIKDPDPKDYGLSGTDFRIADLASDSTKGKKISPVFQKTLDRVKEYRDAKAKVDSTRTALSERSQGYSDQLGKILGPKIGAPGESPPPTSKVEKQRTAWDAAAAAVKSSAKYKGKTPEQVLGPRP